MSSATRRETQSYDRTVSDQLRRLILDRDLRSGDRLPTEPELVGLLGVSRNGVREGLRALEAQGIVTIRHGSGAYLREMDLGGLSEVLTFWNAMSERRGVESLRAMSEVREALETEMLAEVTPRLGSDDLRALGRLVREMEDRADDGQHSPDLDRRFHDVLFRPMDNWVLTCLLRAFWDTFATVGYVDHAAARPPADIAQIHRDILEAVKRGDVDLATLAMRRHFRNSLHSRTGIDDGPQ